MVLDAMCLIIIIRRVSRVPAAEAGAMRFHPGDTQGSGRSRLLGD